MAKPKNSRTQIPQKNSNSKFSTILEVVWKISTALSAFIALGAFLYNMNRNIDNSKAAANYAWKEKTVYSIIKEYEYIGFGSIKQEYLNQAQQEGYNSIGLGDIQDSELERILFDLTFKKMIGIRSDRTYSIQLSFSEYQENSMNLQDTYLMSIALDEEITSFLVTESGKYTIDDTYKLLLQKLEGLTPKTYYSAISHMLSKELLLINQEKKLCINVKEGKS